MNELQINNQLEGNLQKLKEKKDNLSNLLKELEKVLSDISKYWNEEGKDISFLITELKKEINETEKMNQILEEYRNILMELK